MAMKGHRPGGGIASRVNVEPRVKTGTGSRGTHPGGVAQLGQHVGDKATHGNSKGAGYRGEPLHNDKSFQPVPFGNQVALNVPWLPAWPYNVLPVPQPPLPTHGATNPGNPPPNRYRDALEQE